MKRSLPLLLFLLALCASPLRADGIRFRDGGSYQLRCIERPWGCVVPGNLMPVDIGTPAGYTDDVEKAGKGAFWTLTRVEDDFYTLRHRASGLYLTFDGIRDFRKRYVRLSQGMHGDASLWKIYPGRTGLLLINKLRPDHVLDMRRGSGIVGTYAGHTSSVATDNERFYLTDGKGRPVTDFAGGAVHLPAACFDPHAKPAPAPRPRPAAPARLTFTVGGRTPVYDSRSRSYLLPVPQRQFGAPFTAAVVPAEGMPEGKIHVDGVAAGRGGNCKFGKPDGGRRYRIVLCHGTDTVAAAWLALTCLPVVEVTAPHLDKAAFHGGTFRLHSPEDGDGDGTLAARLRYRGDYSSLLRKRSLAVKLTDGNGRDLDRSFLGMRSDNYWILDAMAIDRARMRNRVAMDLWNDFAARPYYAGKAPQARTGVRGRMVEVFLNGAYQGIYCLTERMDRQQAALAKADADKVRGCLYKTRQWGTWTQMGYDRFAGKFAGQRPPGFDNRCGTWANWEQKYPKPDRTGAGDWQPLYEAIDFVGNTPDATFRRDVAARFDLPAVRDYWLFIELLFATDNSGKNMYWMVYDRTDNPMLTPAPWDLDGAFGRSWDGHRAKCEPDNDYRRFLAETYSQNGLFERLHRLDPDDWNKRLAARYRELRKKHFDPDKLFRRFADYHALMRRSGAEARERQRWEGANGIGLDFESESEYLQAWIARRVRCLDRKYGYR